VDDESLRTTSLKSWHQFLGVLKPSGMSYIDQWLTGLGLEYVIPKLKEHGITTPKKLATLSLREMYEVVGVEDAEDRKKLYYLIQRLQVKLIFNHILPKLLLLVALKVLIIVL
jgi:hypothetical protein